MGNLHYFLGVKVVQDLEAGTIWIGQPAYTENLVLHFNMQDAKTCRTPVNASLKLTKASDDSTNIDKDLYQSAFAVCSVARFTANPTEQLWKEVKHILRYIAGIITFGLLFAKGESTECTGYSNADWAGDIDDRKSTSGYMFKIA